MSPKHSFCRMTAELRVLTLALALVIGTHGLAPSSYGRPIESEPVSMDDARTADLATIQQMLEMKTVRHRLKVLGFSQDEIALRLEMASNEDLHQLATQSENVMAGGAVGLVVSVLVVILLVLVILRITSNDTGGSQDILGAYA